MIKRNWFISLAVVCLMLIVIGQAFPNNRTDDPVGVAVSPQTLILTADQGGSVTVHTSIPLANVDCSTVTLQGIPVVFTKADNRGNLVAKFDEAAVKAVVAPPQANLTLSGLLKSGESFSGSDTVRVID